MSDVPVAGCTALTNVYIKNVCFVEELNEISLSKTQYFVRTSQSHQDMHSKQLK